MSLSKREWQKDQESQEPFPAMDPDGDQKGWQRTDRREGVIPDLKPITTKVASITGPFAPDIKERLDALMSPQAQDREEVEHALWEAGAAIARAKDALVRLYGPGGTRRG